MYHNKITAFFVMAAAAVMILGFGIGTQQQPPLLQTAAASNMTGGPTAIIPPSCPPNTQSFERGVCIGPEPTLTYLCDTDPAGLQLVGGELGPQCVLIDDEGNILYSEPAILVDAECNGPFSFIEETLQCATRPGNQQNRGP